MISSNDVEELFSWWTSETELIVVGIMLKVKLTSEKAYFVIILTYFGEKK